MKGVVFVGDREVEMRELPKPSPGPGEVVLAMTLPEALETTRMHRVAGLTGDRTALVTTRPFRAPHHPSSAVGLIGGRAGAEARGSVAGAPWDSLFG
jgi:magnesium chelatase family protein